MNNCSSHVDPIYYQSKYRLQFNNKKEAIEHYIRVGKQKGYFPNREMEVFYCKTLNFDPEYYKRKYSVIGDFQTIKRHWKLYGSKKGYLVNQCEEAGEHVKFLCKCKVKNDSIDKIHDFDSHQYDDQVTDVAKSDSDNDPYIFSEKVVTKQVTKIDRQTESTQSNISSSCPSVPNLEKDHSTCETQTSEISNSNTNNSSISSSNCIDYDKKKTEKVNNIPNGIKLRLNKHNRFIPNIVKQQKNSEKECGGKMESTHNTSDDDKNDKEIETKKEEIIKVVKKKLNKIDKRVNKKSQEDCDSFERLFVDPLYDIKNSNDTNESQTSDDDVTEEHKNNDNDTNTTCSCSNCIEEKNMLHNDHISSIHKDEIKLEKIQKKIKSNEDICNEEEDMDKYIFDRHMELVSKNMTNIRSYLNMCNIHLDTYITLIKQAYQCMSDICNPCNNYMVYNASRIRLTNMLKEIENTTRTSYYKGIPIFYNNADRKCPTSINFPLFVCTNESVNKILRDNFGHEQAYFKVQLMKLSLKNLKLDKYCYPPLNKGDVLTSNTSPIPPCNCPIGKTPERSMYLESDMIKCWDINYHLTQFENALYKVTMTKEILLNYSNLLDIKEELCYKIKVENMRQ